MANQDTTVEVENGEVLDNEVETSQQEDETTQEDTQDTEADTGNEDSEGDGSDDDNSDDETEKETKAEFKKRFTQLKGESLEEYVKNLEDAYANSSTEGQRTAKEAREYKEQYDRIAQLVASDPDFAAKLQQSQNVPKPPVDPALEYAREQMNKQYASEYNAFTEIHPEMVTDTELRDKVIAELDVIGAASEARGVKLSMKDGLRKAWISLGLDEADSKENVVNKVKEQASKPSAPAKTAKPKGKTEFTPEQIAVAKKMGLTPDQLAKYNK
jgi:acyl carrier protein phosphodiesterase